MRSSARDSRPPTRGSSTTHSRTSSTRRQGIRTARRSSRTTRGSSCPAGHSALEGDVGTALTKALRGEHNHFSKIWERATEQQRLLLLALADEPASPYSVEYQRRYGLASSSHVQRAVTSLVREELVGRDERGEYCIVEPFLGEWLKREQSDVPGVRELPD